MCSLCLAEIGTLSAICMHTFDLKFSTSRKEVTTTNSHQRRNLGGVYRWIQEGDARGLMKRWNVEQRVVSVCGVMSGAAALAVKERARAPQLGYVICRCG